MLWNRVNDAPFTAAEPLDDDEEEEEETVEAELSALVVTAPAPLEAVAASLPLASNTLINEISKNALS